MNTLLFKNKYRIKSSRLKGWDYATDGVYFVTICTSKHTCIFGNIENGQMQLNDFGKIVSDEWLKTPKIRQNVELDGFVVMPNHIHGIIIINHNCRDEAAPRLYIGKYPQMSKISPIPNSLSSIIGSYKSICTKQIRKSRNSHFQWQPRFYDHVIRNEKSLNEIREYIRNNPLKWEFDRNNPKNANTVETRRRLVSTID